MNELSLIVKLQKLQQVQTRHKMKIRHLTAKLKAVEADRDEYKKYLELTRLVKPDGIAEPLLKEEIDMLLDRDGSEHALNQGIPETRTVEDRIKDHAEDMKVFEKMLARPMSDDAERVMMGIAPRYTDGGPIDDKKGDK